VEQDRRTAALISGNVKMLGFSHCEVLHASVAATLLREPVAPYDAVFLDPPYPLPNADVENALSALADHGWLTPGALVVVERSSRGALPDWPKGLSAGRDRRYGETLLRYGHAAQTDVPAEE
jgi:16S rRNA (guanine966-N2)-methyltransferase